MNIKPKNLIVATGLTLVVSIGIFMGYQFYLYEVQWKGFYNVLPQMSDCEFGQGAWTEDATFASTAFAEHVYRPLKIPYRLHPDQTPPKTFEGQYIVVRCRPDFSTLRSTGSAHLRLDWIEGESAVFVNGELRTLGGNGEITQIPLLPGDRTNKVDIRVVSRGVTKGSAGMSHPNPIVFTDDHRKLKAIDAVSFAWFREIPVATGSFAIGMMALLALAWVFGIRSPELGWILISLSFFVMRRAAEHESFSLLLGDLPTRIVGFSNFGIYTSIAIFIARFVRLEFARKSEMPFFGLVTFLSACACLVSTKKFFYDYRLMFLGPSVYGTALLACVGLLCLMKLYFDGNIPPARRTRVKGIIF